jgi:hypothetical protein
MAINVEELQAFAEKAERDMELFTHIGTELSGNSARALSTLLDEGGLPHAARAVRRGFEGSF